MHPTDAPPKTRIFTLRRLLIGGLALLVILGGLAWITSGESRGVQRRLAAIQAAGEPVTLAELDEWYPKVSPERNGAPLVMKALDGTYRVPPDKIPERGKPWTTTNLASAAQQLDLVGPVRSNLAVALRHPAFRYDLAMTNGVMKLAIPHLSILKGGAQTLAFWAQASARLDRPTEAAEALLDGLRLSRTLDKEPILISELVRIACLAITARAAEDALSNTRIPTDHLSKLQSGFADAAESDAIARALCGERVFMADIFRMSPAEFARMNMLTATAMGGTPTSAEELLQVAMAHGYRLTGAQNKDYEFYLDTMAEMIRSTRLEGAERNRATRALDSGFAVNASRWNRMRSRQSIPALMKASDKGQRNRATLRCAAAAMAVERYRADHDNTLPADLAVLVPKYLASVPADPMDDKPLKYRVLEKGYVVYSIGEDDADSGGAEFSPGSNNRKGWDYTFTVRR